MMVERSQGRTVEYRHPLGRSQIREGVGEAAGGSEEDPDDDDQARYIEATVMGETEYSKERINCQALAALVQSKQCL